jgi:hypothetical protein
MSAANQRPEVPIALDLSLESGVWGETMIRIAGIARFLNRTVGISGGIRDSVLWPESHLDFE